MIRLLSLGFAVPPYAVTQEQALAAFGWKTPRSRRIFESAAIDTRYTWIAPDRLAKGLSWQDCVEEYQAGASYLGVTAATRALDGHGVDNIGHIGFASVSGYSCPSMSYAIAGQLNLSSDVVHSDLLGMGCSAGLPALERARDYLVSHPDKLALAMTVEICSATMFPAPESDLEYVVATAIFGDGAAAAVLGESDDPRYPALVDFESFFSAEHINLLGYEWKDGRLKVVLSMHVPKIVPPLIKQTVLSMLKRNGLDLSDIEHWIIHPGGRKVLENIQTELGMTQDQT